jgi:hypothetical protein
MTHDQTPSASLGRRAQKSGSSLSGTFSHNRLHSRLRHETRKAILVAQASLPCWIANYLIFSHLPNCMSCCHKHCKRGRWWWLQSVEVVGNIVAFQSHFFSSIILKPCAELSEPPPPPSLRPPDSGLPDSQLLRSRIVADHATEGKIASGCRILAVARVASGKRWGNLPCCVVPSNWHPIPLAVHDQNCKQRVLHTTH